MPPVWYYCSYYEAFLLLRINKMEGNTIPIYIATVVQISLLAIYLIATKHASYNNIGKCQTQTTFQLCLIWNVSDKEEMGSHIVKLVEIVGNWLLLSSLRYGLY